MSKLKMLKFEAATLQNNGKSMIEKVQRLGVAQLDKINDSRLFCAETSDSVSTYDKSIDIISGALKVLESKGARIGVGMFSGRKDVEEKLYYSKSSNANNALSDAYEILRLNKLVSDLQAEYVRCRTLYDSLYAWREIDVPLSGVSTQSATVLVGSFPVEYDYSTLQNLFAQSLPGINEYQIKIYYSSKDITTAAVICHKSVVKEISAFLRSLSFIAPVETSSLNVKERLCELDIRIDEIQKQINSANEKICSFVGCVDDFKFAYDYYTVKKDEYSSLSDAAFSDKTFIIRGYVPEKMAGKLSKVISKCDGVIVYSEPDADDDVPVLLSNGPFSEPCESVVEMYATPGKNDIDPSSVMAFFYYLLFGMMLSDAGYGLIMAVGTALILKKTNVEGGMRKMMKMFFYCGISTVIWGALFGSWFGDLVPVICREFLGIQNPPSVALWFEPIADPITLLLFSFVIGIAHLFLGLTVLGYMKWKEGDKVGAIFDTVPIMLTVLGAAPLAGSILAPVPSVILNIAKYVALAGVVLIVLTNSRSSKNIIARLGGGLYGLYNIASGYLSDILSYSRLLALGLATGSIASVVNMLGVMPQNMVIKTIAFILVFIVGHTLNMAINVLGAYVHTNRLQFVELFSKFYEGGGKAFEPLKFNTKYFKLKEEIDND